MGFIYLVIIGAAAGLFATKIMNVNLGLPQTIALGVIGALLGGTALRLLFSILGMLAGFVGAVICAVLLLWAYKRFIENR